MSKVLIAMRPGRKLCCSAVSAPGHPIRKATQLSAIPTPIIAPPPPVTWQPDRRSKAAAWPMPAMAQALWRGFKGQCPACGKGHVFNGYLRVVPACSACGAPLGRIRADDVPPYATILVTGHIVVPLMLWLERAERPPLWVHAAIWVPLTLALCLGLLRPLKGAVVALMLKLGMFRSDSDD